MCTLIAFHRVWDDAPLVVATNRDEAYDRPATGPAWREGSPPYVAPLDERAGGTWMGANAAGTWVGVTNRRGGDPEADRRSRGLVCRDALARESARDVVASIESMTHPVNPFHLLAADASSAWLVEYEEGVVAVRDLEPGCHVVTNRPLEESSDEPKVLRARHLLEAYGAWPVDPGGAVPDGLDRILSSVLADHGVRGRDAICLHGGAYGTRSAAIWRVHEGDGSGRTPFELAYADGPPCSTPFLPFDPDD